jgi:hypothetical protein
MTEKQEQLSEDQLKKQLRDLEQKVFNLEVDEFQNSIEIKYLQLRTFCSENNITITNRSTYTYFITGMLKLSEIEEFQQYSSTYDKAYKEHTAYYSFRKFHLIEAIVEKAERDSKTEVFAQKLPKFSSTSNLPILEPW